MADDADPQVAAALLSFEGFAHSSGRPMVPAEMLVESTYPLTSEHAAIAAAHVESGASIGIKSPDIQSIRHTHHRLAQMLAVGMDETVAARMCNYSPGRVSFLKSNPAFKDLLSYYAGTVVSEWEDVVNAMKGLSLDAVQEVQERLDAKPESFTNTQLLELIKTTADRSGAGPVSKTTNLNVNVNMASTLSEARKRVIASRLAPVIEGESHGADL